MKIGEFARMCGTKISVLRHYDKEKLLVPEYTDRFSGYRYYSSEQILTFHRITSLKNAGFSLQEIRDIICERKAGEEIDEIFSEKEKELIFALKSLKEAKLIMTKLNIEFSENKAIIKRTSNANTNDLCTLAESEIKAAGYQRISQYKTEENKIVCDVIKLGDRIYVPEDDMPFMNDEEVVGKWEIIGIYAVKEDFYDNLFCTKNFYGGEQKYLYFLPNGESYWAFSWTKGYLNTPVNNEYETEKIGGDLFMFVNLKEYEYSYGGKPTCLVLKKLDSNRYSAESLTKKDNICLPFVNDERVLGDWIAHSFLCTKADFPQKREPVEDLYFKEISFFENGSCRLIYADDVFEGDETVTWTKNYILRKFNWSACEYEIRNSGGTDYMIIEWKSGDYRYGGYPTNYYVFVRK